MLEAVVQDHSMNNAKARVVGILLPLVTLSALCGACVASSTLQQQQHVEVEVVAPGAYEVLDVDGIDVAVVLHQQQQQGQHGASSSSPPWQQQQGWFMCVQRHGDASMQCLPSPFAATTADPARVHAHGLLPGNNQLAASLCSGPASAPCEQAGQPVATVSIPIRVGEPPEQANQAEAPPWTLAALVAPSATPAAALGNCVHMLASQGGHGSGHTDLVVVADTSLAPHIHDAMTAVAADAGSLTLLSTTLLPLDQPAVSSSSTDWRWFVARRYLNPHMAATRAYTHVAVIEASTCSSSHGLGVSLQALARTATRHRLLAVQTAPLPELSGGDQEGPPLLQALSQSMLGKELGMGGAPSRLVAAATLDVANTQLVSVWPVAAWVCLWHQLGDCDCDSKANSMEASTAALGLACMEAAHAAATQMAAACDHAVPFNTGVAHATGGDAVAPAVAQPTTPLPATPYVVVLWSASRAYWAWFREVIAASKLRLTHAELRQWPGNSALEHLWALYGPQDGITADIIRAKLERVGGEPFLVLVLVDDAPTFGTRVSSSGIDKVHTAIFDLKTYLRRRSCGDCVHSSTNATEGAHDLAFFLGGSPKDFVQAAAVELSDDLFAEPATEVAAPGMQGWHSVAEALRWLGLNQPYALLRNAEAVLEGQGFTNDVDVIVESTRAAAVVLHSQGLPGSTQFHIPMQGRDALLVELQTPGDGTSDTAWQRDMLRRRDCSRPDGVCVLAPVDHLFSLLFHMLYHKGWAKAINVYKMMRLRDALEAIDCSSEVATQGSACEHPASLALATTWMPKLMSERAAAHEYMSTFLRLNNYTQALQLATQRRSHVPRYNGVWFVGATWGRSPPVGIGMSATDGVFHEEAALQRYQSIVEIAGFCKCSQLSGRRVLEVGHRAVGLFALAAATECAEAVVVVTTSPTRAVELAALASVFGLLNVRVVVVEAFTVQQLADVTAQYARLHFGRGAYCPLVPDEYDAGAIHDGVSGHNPCFVRCLMRSQHCVNGTRPERLWDVAVYGTTTQLVRPDGVVVQYNGSAAQFPVASAPCGLVDALVASSVQVLALDSSLTRSDWAAVRFSDSAAQTGLRLSGQRSSPHDCEEVIHPQLQPRFASIRKEAAMLFSNAQPFLSPPLPLVGFHAMLAGATSGRHAAGEAPHWHQPTRVVAGCTTAACAETRLLTATAARLGMPRSELPHADSEDVEFRIASSTFEDVVAVMSRCVEGVNSASVPVHAMGEAVEAEGGSCVPLRNLSQRIDDIGGIGYESMAFLSQPADDGDAVFARVSRHDFGLRHCRALRQLALRDGVEATHSSIEGAMATTVYPIPLWAFAPASRQWSLCVTTSVALPTVASLPRGALTVPALQTAAARAAVVLLQALQRAHMQHRDLNANNVAVDVSTGRLVALDFDMSLVVGESMSDWTFVEPLLFRSLGVRVDREMSGRPYGGEYSDVYGMGTVLRWLLPEEVGGVARLALESMLGVTTPAEEPQVIEELMRRLQ